MIDYTRISTPRGESVTVYAGGDLHTITSVDPAFDELLDELTSGAPDEARVLNLLGATVAQTVTQQLQQFTQRVTYDGTDILLDGAPVHGVIAEHITACLQERTNDWQPLVRFLERLSDNPSMVARKELFNWLDAAGLTLNREGWIVAYKGLTTRHTSMHAGGAFINGAWHSGRVPHGVADIIELDRSQVDDDRRMLCSLGLHVGTASFAREYAQDHNSTVVATVLVDPAHVVSVPTDSAHHKMRVCRYRVSRIEDIDLTYLGRSGVYCDDDEDDYDASGLINEI